MFSKFVVGSLGSRIRTEKFAKQIKELNWSFGRQRNFLIEGGNSGFKKEEFEQGHF